MSAPFLPSVLHLGAALPPEVLRNIVDSLRAAEVTYSKGTFGTYPKKGLAVLGQVCHDWAKVVRPRLFYRLKLCNPQDVGELLHFLTLPVSVEPALSTCIREVKYDIQEDQVPAWIRFHKLSRFIPKARLYLHVNRIPGASLLKIFPRTLPPSIFPFHDISLRYLEFTGVNEFASIFNQNVDDGDLDNIGIQAEVVDMPMPRTALRRRQPWNQKGGALCSFSYQGHIGSDSFSSRLKLVSALLRPADRLGLDHASWISAADALVTLVPPNFQVRQLRVAKSKRSPHTPHIFLQTQFKSTWLYIHLYEPPARPGDRWKMATTIRPSMVPSSEFWDEIEDQFLLATQHDEPLYVEIDDDTADRREVFNEILNGRILGKVAGNQRLLLRRLDCNYGHHDEDNFNAVEAAYSCPLYKTVTRDALLSDPLDRDVDGSMIKLTQLEHFWVLSCKDDDEEKEYLEELVYDSRKRQQNVRRKAERKAADANHGYLGFESGINFDFVPDSDDFDSDNFDSDDFDFDNGFDRMRRSQSAAATKGSNTMVVGIERHAHSGVQDSRGHPPFMPPTSHSELMAMFPPTPPLPVYDGLARGHLPFTPPTSHELLAMFPPAPPLPVYDGPTSRFFEREERAFFAQPGTELTSIRVMGNSGGWGDQGVNAPAPSRSRRDDDADRHLPCPYPSVGVPHSFPQSYQPRLFTNYEDSDGSPRADMVSNVGVGVAGGDGYRGHGQ